MMKDMYDIADVIVRFGKGLREDIQVQKKKVAAFDARHPKLRHFKGFLHEHREEIAFGAAVGSMIGLGFVEFGLEARAYRQKEKEPVVWEAPVLTPLPPVEFGAEQN